MRKSTIPTTPHRKTPTSWLDALKAPAAALDPTHWAHARKQPLWCFFKGKSRATRSH